MNKKEFVIICLRLLAIYILISGISSLPSMFSILVDSSFAQGFLIASPLIHIAVGIIMYFYAPKFRSYIIEFSEAEEDDVRISANEKTGRIALMILGFYIFAYALPHFMLSAVEAGVLYRRMSALSETVQWYELGWLQLIPPLVEMIIATFFIIGSDKIMEFISQYDDTFKRMKESNKEDSGDS